MGRDNYSHQHTKPSTRLSFGEGIASAAESHKISKYSDLSDRYDFRPVAIETFGAFGPLALDLVHSLTSLLRARTGDCGLRSRAYRRPSRKCAPHSREAHACNSSSRVRADKPARSLSSALSNCGHGSDWQRRVHLGGLLNGLRTLICHFSTELFIYFKCYCYP